VKEMMLNKLLILAIASFSTVLASRRSSILFTNPDLKVSFHNAMRSINRKKTHARIEKKLFLKARPLFKHRQLAGDDDYYNDDAADDNQDDDGLYYDYYKFDIMQYSFKYSQCQSINTWSDDLAQDQDSNDVIFKKKFVIFKLCPYNYCSSQNQGGCTSNYGEYIIELDDYLNVMKESLEEKMDDYCDYCQECFQNRRNRGRRRRLEDDAAGGDDYAAAGDDYAAAGDDYAAAGDDYYNGDADDYYNDDADDYAAADDAAAADDYAAAGDDAGGAADDDYAAAGDDAADDDYAAAGDDAAEEEDDDAEDDVDCDNDCNEYYELCAEHDDDLYYDHSEMLECTEFENQNGVVRYVGPTCSSDGFGIVLGLFSDQYCSNSIGDTTDAASFTNLNLTYDGLQFFYPQQCLPCNTDYISYEQEDEADITQVCQDLYEQSASCEKSISSNKKYNSYSSSSSQEESLVCNYISNVVSGSYNEYGDIVLISHYFDDYLPENIAIWHVATSLLLILISCYFLLYACWLHRAITKKAPWRPRRGGAETLAGQISRQNSGIVVGRSRSGGSFRKGER